MKKIRKYLSTPINGLQFTSQLVGCTSITLMYNYFFMFLPAEGSVQISRVNYISFFLTSLVALFNFGIAYRRLETLKSKGLYALFVLYPYVGYLASMYVVYATEEKIERDVKKLHAFFKEDKSL